jgi:integrase
MPTVKLTKTTIDRLPAPHPSGRQVLYFDAGLRGFGVLVSGTTTTKSFIVQKKLRGTQTSRRVTIGATNVLALEEARARAIALLSEFSEGLDPKAERKRVYRRDITLRAALDDYLKHGKNLAEASRRSYRRGVETWLAKWLDKPLREISNEMVRDRHEAIAAEVRKGGRYSGEAMANLTMRTLRAIYLAAAENNDLPNNPVRLKKSWYDIPRRERLVRADELPRFYEAVTRLPSRTAVDYLKLLLFTGLRRNEAAGLRWDEIDLAGRVIRLPAKRTKAGRALDLPMSDLVYDLLVARRAIGKDGSFVFAADSQRGYIVDPGASFDMIAAATGIRVSPHDLRRTFVTVASGTAGVSQRSLKGLVNHSLGADITAGYDIVSLSELREPAQLIADRLRTLCEIEAPGVERLRA